MRRLIVIAAASLGCFSSASPGSSSGGGAILAAELAARSSLYVRLEGMDTAAPCLDLSFDDQRMSTTLKSDRGELRLAWRFEMSSGGMQILYRSEVQFGSGNGQGSAESCAAGVDVLSKNEHFLQTDVGRMYFTQESCMLGAGVVDFGGCSPRSL